MAYVEIRPGLGMPPSNCAFSPDVAPPLSIVEREIFDMHERAMMHYRYSPKSIYAIDQGLVIARTHETNAVEDRRNRKFDKQPYILHPLAMAQEAMRMRQHPTIVAACLMHDVLEDVKLGTLQSPTDWMAHIESAFDGYADRDRLMRILRAELKTESLSRLEGKNEVVHFYTNTSLGKTALDYLRQLRGNGSVPTDKDREHIAEVLYDLNRMMSDSYIAKGDGKKEFDPSILIVKILDTWQNLQTPGFWKTQLTSPDKDAKTIAKLLRARVLTNIAEFLGMRKVASEMTQAIAAIHDVNNVNMPLLRKAAAVTNGGGDDLTNRRESIAQRMKDGQEAIPTIKNILPDHADDNMEVVLQMPWATSQTDADAFTTTMGQVMYYIRGEDNTTGTLLRPNADPNYSIDPSPLPDSQALRALFYQQMGRNVCDYAVHNTKKEIIARVRAEARSARYISTTKDRSFKPPDPSTVPEKKLFHADICKYVTKTNGERSVPAPLAHVDTNLVRFLEFMLSPETFLAHTNGPEDRPYVIVINGKVHLATNQTDATVWDMAHAEGLKNPYVRAATSSPLDAVSVERGNNYVLDGMVSKGKLPLRIVIVEEKPPEKRTGKRRGKVFP